MSISSILTRTVPAAVMLAAVLTGANSAQAGDCSVDSRDKTYGSRHFIVINAKAVDKPNNIWKVTRRAEGKGKNTNTNELKISKKLEKIFRTKITGSKQNVEVDFTYYAPAAPHEKTVTCNFQIVVEDGSDNAIGKAVTCDGEPVANVASFLKCKRNYNYYDTSYPTESKWVYDITLDIPPAD